MKIILILHGLLYIFIEFIQYGLAEIPPVSYQYVEMYKTFSLISLLLVFISQGIIILLFHKRTFWITMLLQFFSYLTFLFIDLMVNVYIDNQVTSYPVWSDFYWYGAILAGSLAIIFYLIWFEVKKR